MLLFLSLLGFFLSLILLFFNSKKYSSSIYLGVFFLLVSHYGFCQYVLLYSKSVFLIELLLLGFAIVFPPLYLIGPVLYWYVRSVLTDNYRLKRKDIWHLAPMIIYLLAALPFTFVPLSEKISAANEVVNDVGYIQYFKATFLSDIFSVPAIYLSRPVLILAYTIWAIVLWIRYTADKKLSSVFSSQHFMKVWISVLLGTLLILLISHILLIIRVFELNFSELALALGVLRILSVAGLIGLLISPFFFPSIIYGLPKVPELTGTSHKIAKKTNGNSGDLTKTNSHLETDYLNSIGQKAESYMIENQPYLQPHFNINKLAVEINVPMHHLGYYLRQIKKQSFTEYRNTWRIEHAKKLMMEGKQNDLTLEAIASLSGFSNRNSFRATFQKIEGIPPSAFASSV